MALLSHLIRRVFSHHKERKHAEKKHQQPTSVPHTTATTNAAPVEKAGIDVPQQIAEGCVIPFVLEDVTLPFIGDIKQLESFSCANKGFVKLEGRIESGTFGEVWSGSWQQGEHRVKVAIKFFVPKYDTAKQERKILHRLQWKNTSGTSDCVVKLIGSGSYAGKDFVVVEFIEGQCMDALCFTGDFQKDIDFTKEVFLNLALAIQSIHQRGVVHRDIKAENVIVCENSRSLKLIDFGCSLLSSEKPFPAGTSPYVAPEVWRSIRTSSDDITIQEVANKNIEKCDVFSFGILLWTCLTGKLPYADQSLEDIKKQVLRGHLPKMNTSWSEEVIDIMQLCWKVNPNERINSTQLVEKMQSIQKVLA